MSLTCNCRGSIRNIPAFVSDLAIWCCGECARNTPAGLANAESRVKTVEDLTAPKKCTDPNCKGNKTVGDFATYGTTNTTRKAKCLECEARISGEYEAKRKLKRMMEAAG